MSVQISKTGFILKSRLENLLLELFTNTTDSVFALAKVRDDSLSRVVRRVLPGEDESLETINDAIFIEDVWSLQEAREKVASVH